MSLSGIVGRAVALVGEGMILWRHRETAARRPGHGHGARDPGRQEAGAIPTLKMPTAKGWAAGQTPVAAPGLAVNAFAAGLKHPRWLHVLPNGDVLAAEALTVAGGIRTRSTTPCTAR